MLLIRDSLQSYRHTQTEHEGMEKRYFMQIKARKPG